MLIEEDKQLPIMKAAELERKIEVKTNRSMSGYERNNMSHMQQEPRSGSFKR